MAMVALFVVGVIVIPVYKFSKAVMIRFHLSDVTFEKLYVMTTLNYHAIPMPRTPIGIIRTSPYLGTWAGHSQHTLYHNH